MSPNERTADVLDPFSTDPEGLRPDVAPPGRASPPASPPVHAAGISLQPARARDLLVVCNALSRQNTAMC